MKTLRWSYRQLQLIAAIFYIGDVWAIGAKRSGKSTALVEAIRQCVYEWEPDVNGIMAAPSYGQIERNFMETWREIVPQDLYKEVNDPKNPHLLCYVGDGKTVTIYLASGQYPKRIEGATVGWCAFTELQDGENFWNVVKARVSDQKAKKLRRFGDGLPEEGWLARVLEGGDGEPPVHRVTFTVYDNQQNLHPSYISSMLKIMTPREALKYLEGKMVGAIGAIYPYFMRGTHVRPVSFLPQQKILIGMDFNNAQQTAIFSQYFQKDLICFDELWQPGTVQDQAQRIKDKLKEYGIKEPSHIKKQVVLIPDASGRQKQHARGESSFAILEAAGFVIRAGLTNPYIEDRDASLNVLMENAAHEHHFFVHPRCTRLIESLANLRSEDRETSEWSHSCDGVGYVAWDVAPQVRKTSGGGLSPQDLKRYQQSPRTTR